MSFKLIITNMNIKPTKEQTNLIRVLAILLIINSHIDSLVPIPYISTGSDWKCTIFVLQAMD